MSTRRIDLLTLRALHSKEPFARLVEVSINVVVPLGWSLRTYPLGDWRYVLILVFPP